MNPVIESRVHRNTCWIPVFLCRVAGRRRLFELATLLFLLLSVVAPAATPVEVTVRRLRVLSALEERPYSPIIVAGQLVIPDSRKGQWGLAFFDLDGDDPPRFEVVEVEDRAVNPLRAGFGSSTWWIWTLERRWLVLDEKMVRQASADGRFVTPANAPIVLGDRVVVYGSARAEVTGSQTAYLFELTAQGECVPVLERSSKLDVDRSVLEFQWDGTLAGGLGRSPDGSIAFTDPRNYRIYLLDRDARFKKVFIGANPRWRTPNWSAVQPATPATDGKWWRWALSQVAPKAPVFLDETYIAVLVGIPKPGGGGQSLEADVYRTDGTTVAAAIPVPDIEAAGRLFVVQRTDPKPGDEILVILEPDLPPYLATKRRPPELWSIKVIIDETGAPEVEAIGTNEE